MNQLVWNNKYTLSDGKSLYHAFFHNTCGISKVGDLVSKDNIFLGNGKTLNSKLTPSLYFLLLGVVSAIPNEWRSTIKGKMFMLNSSPSPVSFHWKFVSSANKGKMFDLSSISKILYKEFRSQKEIPSTAQAKLKDEYPNLSVDWKETYLLVFNVTLDTKMRVFQNKF